MLLKPLHPSSKKHAQRTHLTTPSQHTQPSLSHTISIRAISLIIDHHHHQRHQHHSTHLYISRPNPLSLIFINQTSSSINHNHISPTFTSTHHVQLPRHHPISKYHPLTTSIILVLFFLFLFYLFIF